MDTQWTPLKYTNWEQSQPNNGPGGSEEHCAIYDPTVDNQWHDYPCNQKNLAHPICHIIVE